MPGDQPPSAASIALSAASAFDPSGPPACAMSGRPPPPLPPSASAPLRTRSTALKRDVRSSVTPTTMPALPSPGDADDRDDAGADLLLAFVGEAAQILDFDAVDRARHQLDVADGAHAIGAVAVARGRRRPWRASSWRRTVRARDACAPRAALRCARRISAIGAFSSAGDDAQFAPNRVERLARRRCRSAPRCGARRRRRRLRRRPRSSPMSPVRLHMGAAAQFDRPAHGVAAALDPSRRRAPRRRISRRTAPARRTRRRRRAPSARVVTGAFCSTMSLAMSSTRSISSAVIGLGCEKSKRSRSGATSEPFCAT